MKLILRSGLIGFILFAKELPLSAQETPIDQQAIATITLKGYPDFLCSDVDGVWVTNEKSVDKLVFDQAEPTLSAAVPKPCGAMAIGFGSLWVASCEQKNLYRIDLLSGEVLAIIETGLADVEGELTIAIGAGSVWLLTNSLGELSRIDPFKNKVVKKIKVEPHSYAAAFGFGAIWITNTTSGSVQKISPQEEKIVATIPVGPTPRFLTAGAGAVWTLNQGDGTVTRIDPVSTKVAATIDVKAIGSGGDIASGTDKIYVRAKSPLLSVISAQTNTVSSVFGPPSGSGAVRIENGRVWVTAHDVNKIWVLPE